jgi:hypothetical protein
MVTGTQRRSGTTLVAGLAMLGVGLGRGVAVVHRHRWRRGDVPMDRFHLAAGGPGPADAAVHAQGVPEARGTAASR